MQVRGVKRFSSNKQNIFYFGGVCPHDINAQYDAIIISGRRKMINIKMLQEYLNSLHDEHPGVINNIFLANNENHILISTKERYSESSILSTFLNDSLYIIRLNLAREDDKNMLELITESDNQYTIIYNIHDLFIYGVSIRKDKLSLGRQIAIKSLNCIKEQFKEVITWTEAQED